MRISRVTHELFIPDFASLRGHVEGLLPETEHQDTIRVIDGRSGECMSSAQFGLRA